MKTVGIILAGGLSRRFGAPKAFARFQNKYFYEYAVQAVHPFCEEIIIVGREELLDRFPSKFTVITDIREFAGCGPLAGILSAMEFVEADRYIVLPCDMPFMSKEVIGALVARHQNGITAVVTGERHHPLVSVWDARLKSTLYESLQNEQFKVMDLLKSVQTSFIEGKTLTNDVDKIFSNVNRPIDLERR